MGNIWHDIDPSRILSTECIAVIDYVQHFLIGDGSICVGNREKSYTP